MKKTILWYFALCVIVTGIAIFLTATYQLPDQVTFSGGDGALGEALIKSIQESGLKGNLFLIICCVYVVIYLAFYYFCPQRSRSPVNFHPLSIIQY